MLDLDKLYIRAAGDKYNILNHFYESVYFFNRVHTLRRMKLLAGFAVVTY